MNKVQDLGKIGKFMIMELGQGEIFMGMEVRVRARASRKMKLLDKLINHKVGDNAQ